MAPAASTAPPAPTTPTAPKGQDAEPAVAEHSDVVYKPMERVPTAVPARTSGSTAPWRPVVVKAIDPPPTTPPVAAKPSPPPSREQNVPSPAPAARLEAAADMSGAVASPADNTGAHAALLGDAAMAAMEGLPELEVNLGPTTESNLYAGMSGDIGRGGVFAATYERLPLGSQVSLRLTFAGGLETHAVGVVRFVRDGFEADDVPGLGIKFSALTPDGHALVKRFASHREPSLLSE